MAKKVMTQEQKDARALLIVAASALLFFPAMNLLFKLAAFLQYILVG